MKPNCRLMVPERVYHLRPHPGLVAVLQALRLRQLALARLAHLQIALLLPVLRRTQRIDDASVDDHATVHLQPVLAKILVGQLKQAISQIVSFHQVTELSDRGLVRRGLLARIDAHDPAHRAHVVQCFLGGRTRGVEPVLKKLDVQYPLDSGLSASRALRFGITRLDGSDQPRPRNVHFYVIRQTLLASRYTVFFEAGIGRSGLVHGKKSPLKLRCRFWRLGRINQRFLSLLTSPK